MSQERATILVASQDEGTRELVKLTLSGESYEVVEAMGEQDALTVIATHRPTLVFIDANLPGSGGVAITRSAKSQPETSGARFVLLLDKAESIDQADADRAGVDEYLASPFTSLALLKKAKELLD